MKKIMMVTMIAAILYSCDKENSTTQNIGWQFWKNVRTYVKQNAGETDFKSIDFNSPELYPTGDGFTIRFAFLHKSLQQDFILLKADINGNVSTSAIVHLERNTNSPNTYNGRLTLSKLNRNLIAQSAITNGYISALHISQFNGEQGKPNDPRIRNIIPDASETLPEVVVIGYLPSTGGGLSWADYMSFESLLGFASSSGPTGGGGGGSLSGIYSPLSGGGGGGGLGNKNVTINYENSFSKPSINLAAYFKCFNAIPDAGAKCSVTIFTDLPVNDDPTVFFDWYTGATGHSFLQLTKTNGNQTVTQYIGFTAQKPLQAITANNPVPSKIVDNAGHKYNACLTMNITPSQLVTEMEEISFLAGQMPYSITKYNCVDFALQVVNTIRGVNPLIIPKYQIPGQALSASNTPEGLYKLLTTMKFNGSSEAANILTDVTMHAGASHGPCN